MLLVLNGVFNGCFIVCVPEVNRSSVLGGYSPVASHQSCRRGKPWQVKSILVYARHCCSDFLSVRATAGKKKKQSTLSFWFEH